MMHVFIRALRATVEAELARAAEELLGPAEAKEGADAVVTEHRVVVEVQDLELCELAGACGIPERRRRQGPQIIGIHPNGCQCVELHVAPEYMVCKSRVARVLACVHIEHTHTTRVQ